LPGFHFLPRDEEFFTLFKASARNMVEICKLLKDLVDDFHDVDRKVEKITELESVGDNYTHEIIAKIHRTFVTPFDREDMAKLADSLDDIVDFVEASAVSMQLYKVGTPAPSAIELADVIIRCAVEVEAAVIQLEKRSEMESILERCAEIHRLESEADLIFRTVRAHLFDAPPDMAYVIKWHEILQLMEDASDRCDDASNVIEGVILKHA
jgi:predicted phosphate transport protein (TIGR00153 family)